MAGLDFLFDTVDVKQSIVDALKVELPKLKFDNVRVLKSDPQSPTEIPCIGINRVSDDETNMSIADSIGNSYNGATQVYSTQQGTFFAESMEVRVWHTNSDERDALYRAVKAIMFAYRMHWVEKGLLNVTLRMGRDEQDSSMQNAPTVVYWSVITMSYVNPLNVDILSDVAPISAVTDNGNLAQGGNTP